MTHYTESELKNLIQVRRPVDTKVLELVNPLFDAGGYAWASAQPILALDRYANILRMNSVFAEWTSSTFEEMEGVCLLDAMGEEDSVRIIVPLLELFETGKPLTQVLRVRQMEGNYNHAEWIGTPLRNEVGEVVALIGVGRDISSTERTERERTILYEIATQINTARELDDILLSVRSAVLEIGEFDRAGVWVVRDGQLFGAWGTDFQGNIISEKGIVFPVPGYVQEMQERIADAKHFGVLDVVDYWDASGNVKHYETPQDLAYVGLVGNGVLVGVVFVDNFLTGRTIPLQQLERILPLCEQCAMAIMHTTLLQESHRRLERHQAMMERQVRLNALASAMTSYTDIDHILEQVHRGLVTIAGFDRAGIWVVNEERTGVEEKWGTDRAGQHYSVRGGYIPIERLSPKGFLQLINKQKEYYYYEDYSGLMELEEDHAMYGVHANAAIGLHVEDELVGIVTVDNLLTDAPITLEDVEALLPFANQAALAIRNAWLVEAQNLTIQREQSMARITEAVHAELDVTVILGMVWDAVTEWGGFDRVSLWLQDEAHGVFREVWGTDDEGKRTPLSGEQFTDEQFLNEIFPCFILRRTEIIWDTDAKDLNDLPPRHPFIDRKFRAAIGLWVEGEIKGMVLLGHQTFTPTYSRAKVESLVVLVQQVAVALHRSNLRREQHYHSLKAERLHEISAATNAGKPLNDILRLIFDAVREVEHVDRVGIYYIDAVEQIIREVWGTDREGQRVPIQIDNSCLYNESWRDFIDTEDQEYKHYADYGAEKNVSQNNNMFGVKEHLCISIRADGELQGFLCLDNLFSQDPFTPQKIRELTVFADQAAVAIRDSNLRLLHERALLRQQYLFDILQAANSGEALKNVLLRVYEAILVCGGFDRVGIFTLDTKRDILRGAWGTDNAGVCTDMSHQMFSIWGALHFAFKGDNSRPYIILEDFTETYGLLPDNMMYGVRYHATVALHIEGEPFGIFCIDNFFRDTPITAEDIERILPFAEQTAILVRNARLLEERQHFAMRQQRLAEMAESMSAYTSLSEILRQVRDAAVDVGGFDRAGVFVYDAERSVLQGAWGTDKEGKPEDISYEVYPFLPEEYSFQNPNRLFVISSEYEDSATLPADHSMAQVTYNAQVALFADDELVGILCVDNLITDRIISEEDVCTLLPFAFQAAVAVRNARLLEARRMDQERQDILNQIGESIRSNINLSVILQQVRDAIVRIGLFDRAGVFIYNPKRQSLQGTWGTNRDGTIEDISHQVFDQFDMKRLLLWDAVVGKERYTITQDYTDALQLAPGHFMYGVQSHARVPMMVGEEVYGLLCVDTLTSQRTITDADVKLLLPFVDQAAIAVRNAWMLEERERDLERQRRLARLAVAVSTNTELNDVLRLAREAIVKGAGFDRAGIYLLDETRTILKGTWGTNREGREDAISNIEIPAEFTPSHEGTTYTEHGRYGLLQDYTATTGIDETDPMYGVHAHGVVFLESEAEFVGLIYVDNLLTDNPISDEDMLGLLAFANQVVVAIQNARLIQKLQQVQETLVSTERLRAVGELASGVAHNVNNILAAVLGYAELVQEVPNLPPAAMQYAQTIEKAAMDGANIVRRIQHFARKHEQESRTILDVGEMVQEAIVLTRPLWHDQGAKVIELIADIQSGAFLLGVASEIREVVVNLLRNAVDAMPHGGTLNIECTVIGGMVRLRVKDSGAGMTEAVRKRLFEPFFTTKGVGLGTGLGLAIAWGIVDRHGGTIEVESELGRGATFTILLPFANDKVASPSPTLELSQVPGLHLLLVEDEEIVGQSLQEGLQKRGAKVTLVSTAQAALDYLQSTRNTVDVLLSDQGLPGMSGLELLQEVQRLYPHIHRLLISGWGANLQDMQTREVAQRVLAKPVKIETIVRALQEVTQRPVRRK